MEKFIAALRKLFGIEPSVEKITNPITKIYVKLDKLADAEQAAANRRTENAAKLLAEAEAKRKTAADARSWEPARRSA